MKYLFLLFALSACVSYRGVDQVSAIVPGNCYWYYHHVPGWQVIFREKINPFTYRHVGYKGRDIQIECRSRYKGVVYTDVFQMPERILKRFSVAIPCDGLDSLDRL